MNRLTSNIYGVLCCRLYDLELMHCCCLGVQFHKGKLQDYLLCIVSLGLAANLRHVELSSHESHTLGEKDQLSSHRYSNIELTLHLMLQVGPEA